MPILLGGLLLVALFTAIAVKVGVSGELFAALGFAVVIFIAAAVVAALEAR
ncbi:putative membrane protein [Mycolicibacterium hassiacum DSM 44199]|uniref:Putative membrane protein n=1 Tax=Mycolicibacterium hassiacum (strain DSM 44199 / CIP 105218 / JCM 12690 / 3849) TaxID=1122247 RepID=K5BAM0_MYCHD|nr:putative membrane protein [Mycolicibacterium hassiacum DSM 44199]